MFYNEYQKTTVRNYVVRSKMIIEEKTDLGKLVSQSGRKHHNFLSWILM